MKKEVFLTLGLIIIAGIIMFFIGLYQGINYQMNISCNHDLYKYQCDSSPTLDYEFNCLSKFTNITGVYCFENGTYVIKCGNELKGVLE
jgi:hypothetical protein